MKNIKLREEWKKENIGEKMLGKIFKIFPNRDNKKIVIAKLIEIIGVNKTWGRFKGFVIYPESMRCQEWEDNEYLIDWESSFPTKEDLKIYDYCTAPEKYNL